MFACFNPKADRDEYDRVAGNGDISDLGIKSPEGERNADKIAAVPNLAMGQNGHNTIKAKTHLLEEQKAHVDHESQRFVRELSRRSAYR